MYDCCAQHEAIVTFILIKILGGENYSSGGPGAGPGASFPHWLQACVRTPIKPLFSVSFVLLTLWHAEHFRKKTEDS